VAAQVATCPHFRRGQPWRALVLTDAKQRLETLTDEQRRRLASRISRGHRQQSAGQEITRQVGEQSTFPLSFAQQRIWFLNQLGPLSSAFNVGKPIRLLGKFDFEALTRSLNEIVRRHESLRTTFHAMDGVPVQRVEPFIERPIDFSDASHLQRETRVAEMVREISSEYQRPWDIEKGPLLRTKLWKLGDEDHVLLVAVHHIVSDGWSWGLIEQELTALYRAFRSGEPSPLPELPIQYSDFSVWQRAFVESDAYRSQLAYWKERCDGLPNLRLIGDRLDPSPDGSGVHRSLFLSEETTRQLRALCRREGATLFMGLLAAFSALLARYTGQREAVIGSPIANRNRGELEHLIGCFMNPLPLRMDVSGDPSLAELIRRAREVSLGAYANQDVPFDLLVRAMRPHRDPRSSPLFQVMLLLQNYPWQPVDLQGDSAEAQAGVGDSLEDTAYAALQSGLVYPIAIEAYERGPYIWCSFQYDPMFATVLDRAPEHFNRLLEAALAEPDRPAGDLPMLTSQELDMFLTPAQAQSAGIDAPLFVHRAFEAEAGLRPDAVAVAAGDQTISYRDLNVEANRLANRLRALGVAKDVRVGVLLDRSIEMVTALFGVLKAGAAYVPLDPAYPADRLQYIIRNSGASIVVTAAALLEQHPALQSAVTGLTTICLDKDRDALEREPATTPAETLTGANLAYVIYTSGSTGMPKGVQVTHAALANYTRVARQAFVLQRSDRVLQFASISFDTAAEEIYPCLASGASLVLRTTSMISSAPSFLQACGEWGITVLDLPTAYWHELSNEIARHALDLPAGLRLVILGGEAAQLDCVRRWQERFGQHVRLLNTYGPTESTIVATMHDVPASIDPQQASIPIGQPVTGARVYVLDSRLQLAPIGVAGELHIGGIGLARGYLDRPDLTAAAFIPDPYSAEPGARLYKTGDQVRRLENGSIEFLGRVDHQIKLRGFRIELSEIEAALLRHPAIEDAVVLLREDGTAGKRLVAYVTTRDASVDEAVVRRHLREGLPDYMVPSAIVALAAMPLTPNGKIDRDALPAPESSREAGEDFVAPQTGLQRRIASVWQQLLGVERVGLDDNFFDLGGHSLLVVQLHGRLKEIDSDAPSVVDLFKYSTVRALADHLGRSESGATPPSTVDLVRERADRQREAFRRRRQTAEAAVNVE